MNLLSFKLTLAPTSVAELEDPATRSFLLFASNKPRSQARPSSAMKSLLSNLRANARV